MTHIRHRTRIAAARRSRDLPTAGDGLRVALGMFGVFLLILSFSLATADKSHREVPSPFAHETGHE
jgi:hypothetical protein